jgi:hypothetical protein
VRCRHAQLQHAVVLGGGVPLEDGLEALAARYYCQVCGVATTSETNLQVRWRHQLGVIMEWMKLCPGSASSPVPMALT